MRLQVIQIRKKIIIINSIINSHVYIEILYNFLLQSIENGCSYDEVIFQNDNAF